MQIQLRAIWREDSELLVGTPLWFAPADKVDAISVTANVSTDFTTLTNIARKYRWDHKYDDLINETSQKSNKINNIGATKAKESNLSKIPPCPCNMLLVSLIWASLFSADSAKSPN